MSIVLVKGNHDNFIERYSRHFKIGVLNSGARIGEYLFAHGDKALLDFGKKEKPKTIVMGHEHPSIGIPMKIGRTERLRCFLYGRYKRIPMLVLPAMGYFETGSDVNTHTRNIMSPILRKADLKNMHAIAFGNGSTIDFGSISDLRKISQN